MVTRIAHILRIIRHALNRYPMMLASALLFMLAVQGLIDRTYGEQFILTKIAFTSSLGISLFFGMAMLGQRIGRRWLLNLFAAIFLAIFYFVVLPTEEKHFTEKYIYILVPIYILSHLFVAIAPFLFKSSNADVFTSSAEKQQFWHYNKTLFVNFFLTCVFTFVLAGGAQVALFAMDHLFDIGWSDNLYLRTFLSIAITGSTLIFALFHIDGLEEMEATTPYPVIIQFFTQFVLIPLLLLYAGILYVYGIKILVDWELPRGWVSHLVLAYGVLGILALLLVEPLLKDGAKKAWVGWFRRLFYYSMLPLLILLFTAIGFRIGQYGFTEARYFVFSLAVWLSFVSAYFILAARPILKIIPTSLFIVGIAALILPYGNAFSVSIRSQKQMTLQLLQDNDLLTNGMINTDKPISSLLINELQDKYSYLSKRQEGGFIKEMLHPDNASKLNHTNWAFRSIFTDIIHEGNDYTKTYFDLKSEADAQDISAFSHLVRMDHKDEIQFSIGADSLIAHKSLYGSDPHFSLKVNDSTLNLLPLIENWATRQMDTAESKTVDEIVIPFQHGRYEGVLLLEQLTITEHANGFRYFFGRVDFLFRNK